MDKQEPCSCFAQWLERQPHYNQYPAEILTMLNIAWNAGWREGWQRSEFWKKAKDAKATDRINQ